MFNMLLNVLALSSGGNTEFLVCEKFWKGHSKVILIIFTFVVFEPSALKSDHNVLFQLI